MKFPADSGASITVLRRTQLILGVANVCVDAMCFLLSNGIIFLSSPGSHPHSLLSLLFLIFTALFFLHRFFAVSLDAHASPMFLSSQRPAWSWYILPLAQGFFFFLFLVICLTSNLRVPCLKFRCSVAFTVAGLKGYSSAGKGPFPLKPMFRTEPDPWGDCWWGGCLWVNKDLLKWVLNYFTQL